MSLSSFMIFSFCFERRWSILFPLLIELTGRSNRRRTLTKRDSAPRNQTTTTTRWPATTLSWSASSGISVGVVAEDSQIHESKEQNQKPKKTKTTSCSTLLIHGPPGSGAMPLQKCENPTRGLPLLLLLAEGELVLSQLGSDRAEVIVIYRTPHRLGLPQNCRLYHRRPPAEVIEGSCFVHVLVDDLEKSQRIQCK